MAAYNITSVGRVDALRDYVRDSYDEYLSDHNQVVLKRVGLATGVGLSVIALITGLSLELRRTGKDLEQEGRGVVPLRPVTKPDHAVWPPLTAAKEVAGGTLVWIADHIYLVVGGVALHVRKET